jgi:hypothetical protein
MKGTMPMTPEEMRDAGRSFALVAEILDARAAGNMDALRNSDEDLLYALEQVEPLVARLKREVE